MGENWLREAGKSGGLWVWRIDNKSLELSNEPKNNYGLFRSDDCYILLDTRLGAEKNSYSVISWIGKASSPTTEEFVNSKLNDLEAKLGGFDTRTKEVQGHESQTFLRYFKGTIQYVEPVVLSGQMNLRDDAYPTRLYHLKGKRNIRVTQVEITFKNLNSGDVFLLDANNKIFQWNGRSSSRMERAKALDLTVRLRDERMNRLKADVIIIEEGRETDEFWKLLGGKGPISDGASGGEDEEWETKALKEHKMYSVEEVNGQIKFNLVDTKDQPLHSSMLNPEHVYIIDFGTQVFAWNGRNAPIKIKNRSLQFAQQFVKDNNRPAWTHVTKVAQGVEPALFRSHFRGPFTEYIDTPEAHDLRLKEKSNTAGKLREEAINVDALHHPEKYKAAKEDLSVFVPDAQLENVTEKDLAIWFTKDKEKHPLPEAEYGIFYSGESYIIMYSIRMQNGSRRHVVYYWQGRNSAVDDKGTASLLASHLVQTKGRGCTLVRITQGKEPEHFLTHFAGYMRVHKGRRITWAEEQKGKPQLYHIRGTNPFDTIAVQVEAKAFSLNSNDVFILSPPQPSPVVYVWQGKGANTFEIKTGHTMVNRILEKGNEIKVLSVPEGEEPAEFWEFLGGKAAYSNTPELASGDLSARLFQCTDRTGVFKVEEIEHFTQDDLDNDDVMILDTYHAVFVWVGAGSTENERKRSEILAAEYIRAADDGREDCPIYIVDSGAEPIRFSLHFHGWDDKRAKSTEDIYSRKLRELDLTSSVVGGHQAVDYNAGLLAASELPKTPAKGAPGVNPNNLYFPYDRLRVKPLPPGVDGGNLEAFLEEADFIKFVKMTPEEFFKLPKWKQLRVKKEAGLF